MVGQVEKEVGPAVDSMVLVLHSGRDFKAESPKELGQCLSMVMLYRAAVPGTFSSAVY